MKFCRHCGAEMQDEAKVCLSCGISEGTTVKKETAYCYHCGSAMDSQASICVKCGYEQKKSKGADGDGKITRTKKGKILAGVCSGIGQAKGISPWLVRGIFILANFITMCALGTIAYIIAIFAIPKEEE